MTTCIHCGSSRIVELAGRSKDQSILSIPHLGVEIEGYSMTGALALSTLELGDEYDDSDYVAFSYCLDCLKVQTTYQPTDDEIINDLVAS
jgi:hypothetical protein